MSWTAPACTIQAPSFAALSANPVRLHLLKEPLRAGQHDGAFFAQMVEADLRRFLSGQAGPGEYRTLADLPPISPSFDEPAGDREAVASSWQEDLP